MAQKSKSSLDRPKMESESLTQVIVILQDLSEETRNKVLRTVAVFFDSPQFTTKSEYPHRTSSPATSPTSPTFSENRQMTPKAFMAEKNPKSDVERIACLAYYLTHYRETPHFKTADLSKLNTEAAQVRFSNAALAAGNATTYGYLALATKGQKQLSAAGEMFVNALPDRDAAKQAMANMRRRKTKRPKRTIKAE